MSATSLIRESDSVLVDNLDPIENTVANLAGVDSDAHALVLLHDVLELATDTMNGGDFPPAICAEAEKVCASIEEAIEGGHARALIPDVLELIQEWLADYELGESETELRAVANLLSQQAELVDQKF